MLKTSYLTSLLIVVVSYLPAQTFTNWIIGDTSDARVEDYQAGLVLAGGGPDNDNAMQWMLQRANGGDVLVLRASRSDGYNTYFFRDLGIFPTYCVLAKPVASLLFN